METKNNQVKKLMPVTFISGKYNYYNKSTLQETLLLKALRITSDPKKLREMIGAKTVAEVARVYDKLSSRKEYNTALRSLGMDFNWIATGLKKEAEGASKSGDRIKAFQIILKSLGMDAYEDVPVDSGSWEDLILKANDKKDDLILTGEVMEDYKVKQPEVPEAMKKMRERENKQGRSIYE